MNPSGSLKIKSLRPPIPATWPKEFFDLCGSPQSGIVHLTAAGYCSWHTFACAIAETVRPGAVVHAIPSSDLDRPAPRPGFSVLSNDRYASWTGTRLPSWEEGLAEYLKEEAL